MPLFSPQKPEDQRGFTLPEILTTMTIIGLISTIATVSYDSVRASARDVKRVSDLKQIQTSIEFYYENHGAYPDDGQPGDEGAVLGLPETSTLSDAGFSAEPDGTIYMALVPKNPEPGGSPYVYRSLDPTGTNCDRGDCGTFAVLFTLEKAQGNYASGPHAITSVGSVGAEGGFAAAGVTQAGGEFIGVEGRQATLEYAAATATAAVADFVQDERVRTVAGSAVAPAAAAVTVANAAFATSVAASGTASVAGYWALLLAQPFAFLFRRKRKAWGTVYNPLSRLGEDLVIVRLRDAATSRIVRSVVTDGDGRYSIIAQQGRYRVEASKGGFVFPSRLTAGLRDDGPFPYLYHGQEIEVGPKGAIVTPNIPLDPVVAPESDEAVRRKFARRRLRRSFAEWSLFAGALALAINPSVFVALLFAAQVIAFLLFRRLAVARESQRWGVVFDQATRRPVQQAIARVFEKRFNKLLESQATDARGRYHFRVGGNVYYLTVTKPGYHKTETAPIDLSKNLQPTVIASDLPLAPVGAAPETATPAASQSVPSPIEPSPVGEEPAVPPAEPAPADTRPDPSHWLNSL